MCGIVGYTGRKQLATNFVIEGLEALEYRGYDSAGITLLQNRTAQTFRQLGRVENLKSQLEKTEPAHTAIGHTRWATHGEPTVANAHPHSNSAQTIFVVHNGIVENYKTIRTQLISKGYVFTSETDSEVIPHLIDYHLESGLPFEKAFTKTLNELEGAIALT